MVDIKNYLWILPFASFTVGYMLMSSIYQSKKIETPTLIGKPLHEAVTLASAHGLNLRMLEQREDAELPNDTIIQQNPSPQTISKSNQTIFCVISKKPIVKAPHLVSKQYETILNELRQSGIRAQTFFIDSSYPKNFCFAQSPNAQTTLKSKSMVLYVSSGEHKPVIFPDLKHKTVEDVIEFLKPYNITPVITHAPPLENHTCSSDCVITNQRPLPGSIVNIDSEKPLYVQLQVKNI